MENKEEERRTKLVGNNKQPTSRKIKIVKDDEYDGVEEENKDTNFNGRAWVFTCWWKDLAEDPDRFNEWWDDQRARIKYSIWKFEDSPKTGNTHVQGYVVFKNSTWRSTCRKLLDRTWWHLANGKPEDNFKYITKEETTSKKVKDPGPFEIGSIETVGQGKRNDIEVVANEIKEGKSLVDVAFNYPGMYVKYYKGFEVLRNTLQKQRDFKTKVYYYYGDTGKGKTSTAVKEVTDHYGENYYMKTGMTKWWNDYDGHEVVIWDEFRYRPGGDITIDYLLGLLDRYRFNVETKGGMKKFVAKKLYITSNYDLEEMFGQDKQYDALMRRIDVIKQWTNNGIKEIKG